MITEEGDHYGENLDMMWMMIWAVLEDDLDDDYWVITDGGNFFDLGDDLGLVL